MTLRRFFGSLALVAVLVWASASWAAVVDQGTAALVAQNLIHRHTAHFGSWNGQAAAAISGVQPIVWNNQEVAWNFSVTPSGHVLVARSDRLSPVLLYSATSSFDPALAGTATALESWIVPEVGRAFAHFETPAFNVRSMDQAYEASAVAAAWRILTSDPAQNRLTAKRGIRSVGPLMTSRWGQETPYNLLCPMLGGEQTIVGCVATAWSQLLRYWQWPDRGTGSHSYYWETGGRTLTANFDHAYDWANMPDELTASSTQAQKDAVARLCADVGISADMDYDVDESGSGMYADEVLHLYFKYKPTMTQHSRTSYPDADQWMALFQTEIDASPGRPVVFSIFDTTGGGHETIIDGYQDGATDMVHINYGWNGNYDGWYDVTQNFQAIWTWEADSQIIVTGIEPDKAGPTLPYVYYLLLLAGSEETWTGIALSNAANAQATAVQMAYYRHDGTAETPVDMTLPAGGQSAFLLPLNPWNGWAKVSAQNPLKGLILVGDADGSSLASLNMAQAPLTTLVVPQVATGDSGWGTDVLLTNPSGQAASVTLSYRDTQGQIQDTYGPISIPAQAQQTLSLGVLFGTRNGGSVVIESTQALGGVAGYAQTVQAHAPSTALNMNR
ncbi:MAG: hypothetical protein EOM25_07035 [Deltaproteobacteria bacterium]|nr:hypothetical protein [Deltaproteobacteria bacterium]